MKHLILIASSVTLISSYSLASEHSCTFNNKLPNETVEIFSTSNNQKCSLSPNTFATIPVYVEYKEAIMLMTTPTIGLTAYMIRIPEPLPKNINFTYSPTKGLGYIDILLDGKCSFTIKNEHRELPHK